ncbi:hypothetical protein HOLleu_14183 [Holothuria leucospilota]|uniref:Uncharacterized protein n=1 Tax=Holothuria leucospilota TaxID=206669 RepID=A0A9Q1H8S1_HOLLE|nr:hypothetical protein HOLleu_14183 [Holothuria leucospilota]
MHKIDMCHSKNLWRKADTDVLFSQNITPNLPVFSRQEICNLFLKDVCVISCQCSLINRSQVTPAFPLLPFILPHFLHHAAIPTRLLHC